MGLLYCTGRGTGEGVDRDREDEEAEAETVTDEADLAPVRDPATGAADPGAQGAARETGTPDAAERALVTGRSATKSAKNARRSAIASGEACRQSKRIA